MNDNKPSILRFLPPWLSGSWGVLAIFFIVYTLVYVGWIYFHWGGEENVMLIGDLLYLPPNLVTIIAAWRVFAQKEIDPRTRRMWLLLGLGLVSYFIASAIWTYLENVLEVPPFPSISDLFYLLFAPLVFAGLLHLPGVPLNRRERWQFIMEILALTTAAGLLMWHYVIQPTAVASAGDFLSQSISVAYPVTDLVLFTGITAALLRKPDHDTRQSLWLLLAAMAFFIAADVAFAYTNLAGTYFTGSWIDALWNIAFLFILFAALRHAYRSPEVTESAWEQKLTRGLPLALNLVIILAFALTIYEGIRDFTDPNYFWLFAGSGLLLLLVIGRQVVSPNFANTSLRTKLVTAFLVVTLLPLAILFFLNDNANRTTLTNNASRVLSGAALEAAESLDNYLTDNLTYVRSASQLHIFVEYLVLPANERAGSETESALYTDLRAIARRDQTYITSVSLIDRRGRIVADTVSAEVGEDSSKLIYFTQPRDTGLPYVSPVIFDDEQLSLIFAAPVRDEDGEIIGVIRIRYDASVLQQFVTAKVDALSIEGSDIILLDENYIHLADGEAPDQILKLVMPLPADTVTQLQAEGRLPNQPIEELSSNLPEFAQGLANISQQPIFAAETQVDGGELEQVAVASLKTQPWLIAVTQTQATYLAPIAVQTRTAGVTVLVMVMLVVVVAVFASQTIATPIVQLRNVATQIAGGDFTAQATVASGDETGQLADAFNTMTSRLRQSFDELSHRAADMATVAEVGTAISTTFEVDQLLQKVVELSKERFGLYHSHIYLLDEKGETLVLASGAGEAGRQMLEQGLSILLDREQSLVARAARERQGVTVNDVRQVPDFMPNPLLPDTRSELAVPMIVGDRVIGVFDVQSDQVGRFADVDIDIQTTLAAQVAVALQNARQVQESLRLQEQYTLAIEGANDGIWDWDIVTNRVFFSPRWKGMIGYREDELNNGFADFESLLHPEDHDRVLAHVNEYLTGQRNEYDVEFRFRHKDGSYRWIRARGKALRDEKGAPYRMAGSHTDITSSREAQDIIALRAREQEALNHITQSIQGATTIDAALQVAVRELGKALGIKSTSVTLVPDALSKGKRN